MKKIISILIPILAFIFLVGGTYYYFTSGNKNFKEEYSKYIEKLDNFEDLEKYLDKWFTWFQFRFKRTWNINYWKSKRNSKKHR